MSQLPRERTLIALVAWLTLPASPLALSSCGTAVDTEGEPLQVGVGFRIAGEGDGSATREGDQRKDAGEGAEGSPAFALSAAQPSNVVTRLSGCASGTSAPDGARTQVIVYVGDRGCEVQLRRFDWKGSTWTRAGGGYAGASQTQANSLLFSNGTQTIAVFSVRALSNPIVSSDSVTFGAGEIGAGTPRSLSSIGESRGTASIAHQAPNLTLAQSDMALVSIDAAGRAKLRFRLECGARMTGSICFAPGGLGEFQNVTFMKAVLFPYVRYPSPVSQSNLSVETASAGAVPVTAAMVVAPSGSDFDGGITIELDTPGALVDSKSLVLAVGYQDIVPTLRAFRTIRIEIASGQ